MSQRGRGMRVMPAPMSGPQKIVRKPVTVNGSSPALSAPLPSGPALSPPPLSRPLLPSPLLSSPPLTLTQTDVINTSGPPLPSPTEALHVAPPAITQSHLKVTVVEPLSALPLNITTTVSQHSTGIATIPTLPAPVPQQPPQALTHDMLAASRHRRQQYRGVQRSGEGWKASIYAKGTLIDLGAFDSAENAARAYDRAVLKYKRARSELNFADSSLGGEGEHGEECEVCEAGGGEMLSCDSCSAMFHLSCCSPDAVAAAAVNGNAHTTSTSAAGVASSHKSAQQHWYCALCSLMKGKAARQQCPFCGAQDIADVNEMRMHFQRKCRTMRQTMMTSKKDVTISSSPGAAPKHKDYVFQEGADAETVAEAERILDRILIANPVPPRVQTNNNAKMSPTTSSKRLREDPSANDDARHSKKPRLQNGASSPETVPSSSPTARSKAGVGFVPEVVDPIPVWYLEAWKQSRAQQGSKKLAEAPFFHGAAPWNADMDIDAPSTHIIQAFVRTVMPPTPGEPQRLLATMPGEILMLLVFGLLIKISGNLPIPEKGLHAVPSTTSCGHCCNPIKEEVRIRVSDNLLLRSCIRRPPELLNFSACVCTFCKQTYHLNCTREKYLMAPRGAWHCGCKRELSTPAAEPTLADAVLLRLCELIRNVHGEIVCHALGMARSFSAQTSTQLNESVLLAGGFVLLEACARQQQCGTTSLRPTVGVAEATRAARSRYELLTSLLGIPIGAFGAALPDAAENCISIIAGRQAVFLSSKLALRPRSILQTDALRAMLQSMERPGCDIDMNTNSALAAACDGGHDHTIEHGLSCATRASDATVSKFHPLARLLALCMAGFPSLYDGHVHAVAEDAEGLEVPLYAALAGKTARGLAASSPVPPPSPSVTMSDRQTSRMSPDVQQHDASRPTSLCTCTPMMLRDKLVKIVQARGVALHNLRERTKQSHGLHNVERTLPYGTALSSSPLPSPTKDKESSRLEGLASSATLSGFGVKDPSGAIEEIDARRKVAVCKAASRCFAALFPGRVRTSAKDRIQMAEESIVQVGLCSSLLDAESLTTAACKATALPPTSLAHLQQTASHTSFGPTAPILHFFQVPRADIKMKVTPDDGTKGVRWQEVRKAVESIRRTAEGFYEPSQPSLVQQLTAMTIPERCATSSTLATVATRLGETIPDTADEMSAPDELEHIACKVEPQPADHEHAWRKFALVEPLARSNGMAAPNGAAETHRFCRRRPLPASMDDILAGIDPSDSQFLMGRPEEEVPAALLFEGDEEEAPIVDGAPPVSLFAPFDMAVGGLPPDFESLVQGVADYSAGQDAPPAPVLEEFMESAGMAFEGSASADAVGGLAPPGAMVLEHSLVHHYQRSRFASFDASELQEPS